jgi:hypothetical protein
MATIRFRDLVKQSGKPEVKSLWSDPKEDRQFMRAVKQNRVLTIVQEPTAKKADFGEIGFRQGPHASFFVFPKPLPTENAKVIGIKYDLIEESAPRDVISPENLKRLGTSRSSRRHTRIEAKGRPGSKRSGESRPVEEKFRFQIRTEAVLERTVEVQARSRLEAQTKAEEAAKGQGIDWDKARIRTRVKLLR